MFNADTSSMIYGRHGNYTGRRVVDSFNHFAIGIELLNTNAWNPPPPWLLRFSLFIFNVPSILGHRFRQREYFQAYKLG